MVALRAFALYAILAAVSVSLVWAPDVCRFVRADVSYEQDKINPYYKELTAYDGFEGGSVRD